MDPYFTLLAASFISYLIFKRFEPPGHDYGALALLLGAVPVALSFAIGLQMLNVLVFYYGFILAFVAIYRLSPFHPLAEYPGPWQGRLTQFWLAYWNWKGRIHIYYRSLHEKYGDVVRVGPNELSFRSIDAIQPIMGINGLNKGPFWDNRQPGGSVKPLVALKDWSEHKRRRQPWNMAFGREALKGYEEIVVHGARSLLKAFSQRENSTIDIGQWMTYFAFDFMGSFVFGNDFGLVKKGSDPDGLWHILESSIKFNATVAHIPWAGLVLRNTPGIREGAMRLTNFAIGCAKERIDAGTKHKDLFFYLSDEDGKLLQKPERKEVSSDGLTAIVAGSDTTAMTLTGLFYFLMKDFKAYERLQAEIDAAFPQGIEPLDMTKMANMPFLNACINEVLRLLPPVLSGSQRSLTSKDEGRFICGRFVPGPTQVFVHMYSLQRDPRYFSPYPDSFWPQRWLPADQRSSSEEVVHNLAAYIPFSFGPAGCVGKPLALMELRAITCFVLQKYHIKPASGEREAAMVERWEETLQDFYTTQWGPLPVVLTRRF